MQVGLRVVRGPGWKWGDQDGAEGQIGTVVKPGMQECDVELNGTVFVRWDSGQLANYRVGCDGAYDLRLFDNSTTGSIHPNSTCVECRQGQIVGIRWKCSSCVNVVLCHDCYRNDKHNLTHTFIRFDWTSSDGYSVPIRKNARKVEAKGIFPGATVVRGPDWRWSDQDGGEGNPGLVLAIVDRKESNTWNSWCKITWSSGHTNEYRAGHDGKLDVIALDTASSGYYYPDHLAVLGTDASLPNCQPEDDNYDDEVPDLEYDPKPGDRVQVCLDPDIFEAMQENHGGWNPMMAVCVGRIGRVKQQLDSGDLLVQFTGFDQAWRINPHVLTRAKRRFHRNDKVQISPELLRVMSLQEGHGGWVPEMQEILGEIGCVLSEDSDFDVRVQVGERVWTLNPLLLSLVPTKSSKISPHQHVCQHMCTDDHNGDGGDDDDDGNNNSDDDNDESLVQIVGRPGIDDFLHSLMNRESFMSMSQDLVEAAGSGNVGVVRNIIGRLPLQMETRNSLCLALKAASLHGHVDIVRILLEAGADVQARDENGDTQIHFAVFENHPDVLQLLLDTGGVDINIADFQGLTPLHVAVHKGHSECVKQLIKYGCNPNVVDSNNNTPLHEAVRLGNHEIINMLTNISIAFDFRKVNSRGFTVLHEAAFCNNCHAAQRILDVAPSLVDVQKVDGMSALHYAAVDGHIQVVDILIRLGKARLDLQNVDGHTALSLAVHHGWTHVIELLVLRGANVNLCDGTGNSPLHVSVSRHKQHLTSEYAPKALNMAQNITEIRYILPSQLCADPWIATACFLIQHGADISLVNFAGKTALDCTSDHAVCDVLLHHVKMRKGSRQCQMCSKALAVIFLPCGHQIVCGSCSSRTKTCLTCKRPIAQRLLPDVIPVVPENQSRKCCSRCFVQHGFLLCPCLHTCCKACGMQITDRCPVCRRSVSNKVELFG